MKPVLVDTEDLPLYLLQGMVVSSLDDPLSDHAPAIRAKLRPVDDLKFLQEFDCTNLEDMELKAKMGDATASIKLVAGMGRSKKQAVVTSTEAVRFTGWFLPNMHQMIDKLLNSPTPDPDSSTAEPRSPSALASGLPGSKGAALRKQASLRAEYKRAVVEMANRLIRDWDGTEKNKALELYAIVGYVVVADPIVTVRNNADHSIGGKVDTTIISAIAAAAGAPVPPIELAITHDVSGASVVRGSYKGTYLVACKYLPLRPRIEWVAPDETEGVPGRVAEDARPKKQKLQPRLAGFDVSREALVVGRDPLHGKQIDKTAAHFYAGY